MLNSREFDLNKFCRTCLSTGQMRSLHDISIAEVCLAEMLLLCTSVQYKKNSPLPEQICNDCVSELNRSYKFAIKCRESEEKLKKYLLNNLNLELDIVKHEHEDNTGTPLDNEFPTIKVRSDLNELTNPLLPNQSILVTTENKNALSNLLPSLTNHDLNEPVENQKNDTQLPQIITEIELLKDLQDIENVQNRDLSWFKNEIDHSINLQTDNLVINNATVNLKIENNSEIINSFIDPLQLPTETPITQITESLNGQSVTVGNIIIKSDTYAGEDENDRQQSQIINTNQTNPIVNSSSKQAFIPIHPIENLETLIANILPENIQPNSNVTADVAVIEQHNIPLQENQNYQTDTNLEASNNVYEFRKRAPRLQTYIESGDEDCQSNDDYCDSMLSHYEDSDSDISNDENTQSEKINKKQSSKNAPLSKQLSTPNPQTEIPIVAQPVNYQIEQPRNQIVLRNINYQGVSSSLENNQSEISTVVVNRAGVATNCGSITNVDTLPEKTVKTACKCNMCLKSCKQLETYPCLICGDKFSLNDSLKKHIMHKHTNKRPHKYTVTKEAFAIKDSFINHTVSHSEVIQKPYTVTASDYATTNMVAMPILKQVLESYLPQQNNVSHKSDQASIINHQAKPPNIINPQIEYTNSAYLQNELPNKLHQNEPYITNYHRESSNNINNQSEQLNNTYHQSVQLISMPIKNKFPNNIYYQSKQSNTISYMGDQSFNQNSQTQQFNNMNNKHVILNNAPQRSINTNNQSEQSNTSIHLSELSNYVNHQSEQLGIINHQAAPLNIVNRQIKHTNSANHQNESLTNRNHQNKLPNIPHQNEPYTTNYHRESSNKINNQSEQSNSTNHQSAELNSTTIQTKSPINIFDQIMNISDQSINPNSQKPPLNNMNNKLVILNNASQRSINTNNQSVHSNHLSELSSYINHQSEQSINMNQPQKQLNSTNNEQLNSITNDINRQGNNLNYHNKQSNNRNYQYIRSNNGANLKQNDLSINIDEPSEQLIISDLNKDSDKEVCICEFCGGTLEKNGSCITCDLEIALRAKNAEMKCHKCELCNREFKYLRYLTKHMRSHTTKEKREKQHTCNVCARIFSTKGYLQVHERTHTMETPYSCDICNKSFSSAAKLRMHKSIHSGGGEICFVCGKILISIPSLNKHMQTHSSKLFPCEKCDKVCSSSRSLYKHNAIKHSTAPPVTCDICGKTFRIKDHLKKHMTTHDDSKPYSCTICGKSVRRKQFLAQHMRTHTNERPHVCTICKKRFKSAANLFLHKRTHDDKRPYACTLCDLKFKIRHHLNAHLERKHPSPKLSEL